MQAQLWLALQGMRPETSHPSRSRKTRTSSQSTRRRLDLIPMLRFCQSTDYGRFSRGNPFLSVSPARYTDRRVNALVRLGAEGWLPVKVYILQLTHYFHPSSELTSSASSCDCLCNSRYMASLYSWYALHAWRKLLTTTALTTMKTASPHTVQASTCTAGVINVIKPIMLPPPILYALNHHRRW